MSNGKGKKKRMRGLTLVWGLSTVAFIVVMSCLCNMVMAPITPAQVASPTAQAPAQVPTTRPTAVLTSTPIPTVISTVAPSAVPTVPPFLTEEERAYLEETSWAVALYKLGFEEIGELMDQMGDQPWLLYDAVWRLKVEGACDHILGASGVVRHAAVPSARLEEHHAQLLEAGEHYLQSIALYLEGLASEDPQLVIAARVEIEKGSIHINLATQGLERLRQEETNE